MTNIILGVLFVLFLICLYKIACLREDIKNGLEKSKNADFVMAEGIDDNANDLRVLDKQLMSLRVDFNEFHDHYQWINDRKVEKLVSKKPAKKKAYVKKSK